MIRILPIGSGSTGNCMVVRMGAHTFLIDIGVSWTACRTAMADCEIAPDDIEAVFITHTHSDHIRGLAVTAKHLDVPYYASGRTRDRIGKAYMRRLRWNEPTEVLPGLTVTAFETSHDCPGSCGFVFEAGGEKLGYATDLGTVTPHIHELLTGARTVVIEANHDVEMLRNGPYPYPLQQRILSEHGHLSNDQCAAECAALAEQGTVHFLLAHLSRENNTPACALAAVGAALAGTHADHIALPVRGDEMITLE